MKKKIVILTGAGISAESGIKTFRDSQGLWEEHKVEDVASPRGWLLNPELVLEFYNQRRRQAATAEPNDGHKEILRLNEKYDVSIVTQNIDELHEKAGSVNILHLHGKITESKSSGNEDNIKYIGYEDIVMGDLCEEGYQMRPNIVWFGESVPMINEAESIAMKADIFIIIGTSLNVYPAAGLMRMTKTATPIYVIDPSDIELNGLMARRDYIHYIKKPATTGVKELVDMLLAEPVEEV